MVDKPRIRIAAGSQPTRKQFTADSFQNVAANLGYGTQSLPSAGTYGFNPVSRLQTKLEWMYRGSWLVRKVVDCPANDMTRAGIDISTAVTPAAITELHEYWSELRIWKQLNDAIKWGRLYGGCLAVIMIQGQDESTPLRLETVAQGAFRGLLIMDRWMVQPSLSDFVDEFGPDFGMPKYYRTITDGSIPRMTIHYSRVIRFEGDDLPYWQRIAENGWSASVVEQLYDRLLAFDSATTGAAHLVYKAHLRTYSVKGMREMVGAGGSMLQAFTDSMQLIRLMQSIEGLTVIDAEDKLEYHTPGAFSGLSDALTQFSQQLAGACGIPLVILFGQSPSGFSTGETDVRNYYDRISAEQKDDLTEPSHRLLRISFKSKFGVMPPQGLEATFNPLWQLTEKERADNAATITSTVVAGHSAGLVSDQVALKELRQSAQETGVWSNISDEDIANAEDTPLPPPSELIGPDGQPLPDAQNNGLAASPAAPGDAPARAAAEMPPKPASAEVKAPPPGTSRMAGTPDGVDVHLPDGHPNLTVNRG
jgi:phage-related protein (TIGR01555 family)